ncbi:hypothetical protein ACHWQZ_G012066 [Mnemiopsis leidyi]
MTSILDWYEDLHSKTSDSDFGAIPETNTFKVKIHEGNNVYADWDLSDDLREEGMAFRNYTNTSLNVNLELLLMHEDLIDKFKDDESLKNILELSNKHPLNSTTVSAADPGKPLIYTLIGLAILAILIGLVGLKVKTRVTSQTRVVRITRFSGSLVCILTGILSVVEEFVRSLTYFDADRSERLFYEELQMSYVVIGGAANCFLKGLLISWKVFTVIINVFQNVMLHLPFLFCEHKKAFGRLFLRASLVQSVTILIGSLVWVFVLMVLENNDCDDIRARSEKWNLAFASVGGVGTSRTNNLCEELNSMARRCSRISPSVTTFLWRSTSAPSRPNDTLRKDGHRKSKKKSGQKPQETAKGEGPHTGTGLSNERDSVVVNYTRRPSGTCYWSEAVATLPVECLLLYT